MLVKCLLVSKKEMAIRGLLRIAIFCFCYFAVLFIPVSCWYRQSARRQTPRASQPSCR